MLYRLHIPAAIGQGLHDLQQQRRFSLYAQATVAESVQLAADAALFDLGRVSDVEAPA